jgi:hypothetical protein
MYEMTDKRVVLTISTAKGLLFYNGYIKYEDDDHVLFVDDKLGEISINKAFILSRRAA